MIHTVVMLKNGPLLGLKKGDVLLIDEQNGVELYRKMDYSYATILPTLVAEGAAETSLSVDDLAAVVSGLPVPARDAPAPERRGPDRRGRGYLKLEA